MNNDVDRHVFHLAWGLVFGADYSHRQQKFVRLYGFSSIPGAVLDSGLVEEHEADGSHVFIGRAAAAFIRLHQMLRNVADARVARWIQR